ncbi:hypothetical protein [Acetobacterium bakii]|uniref:Uncharacterized protein n=1 Tax=Acetobacterium bakii TaxID=52689 RepID=A0A0L6U3U2_9FIRM|nr:hypothetical protein [Acetobacterium bakii]KNZ42450.1 hypothetical protein AKG39_06725 [Acetobacterium bakii]
MFRGFSDDYKNLTGAELEILTGALFQTLDYYIDVNLTWMEERESSSGSSGILEIDILAKSFSPLKITRILTECKRGCDFNDYFKFLGICEFMKVDSKYLVCQSSQFVELYNLGLHNDLFVVEPDNILATFSVSDQNKLNLLRGVNLINSAITDKSQITVSLHKGQQLTYEERGAYNLIRKYLISLNGWIWKESDPRTKQRNIFELIQKNKGFVNFIGYHLGLKREVSENLMRDNALCTAAGYVVLQTKISYIVCAVECAIESLVSPDESYLTIIDDKSFISCVEKMKSNIVLACKLPHFIQIWINVFGGMVNNNDTKDIELFASFFNERKNVIEDLLEMLEDVFCLFSGSQNIQWGFIEDFNIKMFRYVPRAIRGIGISFRKKNNIDISDFCFAKEWKEEMTGIVNRFDLEVEEN